MSTPLQDLLPILARISAERETRFSLRDLAAQAGRSPSHFQRVFARVVGESPKQFTLRLQLECAAALLLTTEDTVLDVALRAGFDSHEGFTRAFGRHFGRSPRAFRSDAAHDDLRAQLRSSQLVRSVGPCLRLFHSPVHPQPESKTMNYDITQQSVEPMTLLYQSTRVELAKLGEALGRILPAAYGYATQNGIAMTGLPTCRYTNWGPAMVTIEAGVPVAAGAKGNEEVLVATFEATRAAVTIHTGPYDSLGDAHAALELYLRDNDLEAGAAPYEVYLTDPGEVPDPAEWKTQVVWPIAGS